MTLPVLLSVPHAGLLVPPEAAPYCRITTADIVADGDEQAAEIYALRDDVAAFVSTEVARAVVDLNRAEDDRLPDGVVKTHTCWNVPVYDPFPPAEVIEELLAKYYRPYHARLTAAAGDRRLLLAVDGHTMAAEAPPIGPDPGSERPALCLGDLRSQSLPPGWIQRLARCFEDAFGLPVAVNEPFAGGYITRAHCREMPWVQVEMSRAPFLPVDEKRHRLLAALEAFCRQTDHPSRGG